VALSFNNWLGALGKLNRDERLMVLEVFQKLQNYEYLSKNRDRRIFAAFLRGQGELKISWSTKLLLRSQGFLDLQTHILAHRLLIRCTAAKIATKKNTK
jgi:hypothetical protein